MTAPFALIGSLFGGGGGAALSYLDFAPGSAAFDTENDKKLGALTKALKLEIVGHADAENDREALRADAFDRKVKAQNLEDLAKAGQAPDSLGGVTVEPGKEYQKYLAKAYSQEKFPKPRNVTSLEKSLPVTEMEKLMLTNIVVGADDLRQLAMQRADAVKGAWLKASALAPERLLPGPILIPPDGPIRVGGSVRGRPERLAIISCLRMSPRRLRHLWFEHNLLTTDPKGAVDDQAGTQGAE